MFPGPPQELKRLSLRAQRGLEEAMTGSILKGKWDSAGIEGAVGGGLEEDIWKSSRLGMVG